MKKRKIFINMIAGTIAMGVGVLVNLKFWIPIVLPSYGWLIADIGAFAVTLVIYLAIYLPLIRFLAKKS